MDALRAQLETMLRGGSPERALQCAQQMAAEPGERTPREVAIEIAKTAATVYRDFVSEPVEKFAAQAPEAIGAEQGEIVSRALTRLFNLSETWEQKVRGVHKERLARDLRHATRMRNMDEALENARLLISQAGDVAQRRQQAAFIGGLLGTLPNQQAEAEGVLREIVKRAPALELDGDGVQAMLNAHRERAAAIMNVRMDAMELEWTRVLVSTQTDMRNAMPEKTKFDEPDEAVLRDVGDIFRSVARVPLRRGAQYFPDVVQLFQDFAPAQLSTAAKMAGVEERSYGTLGFTAKKAVLLTFQDIGRADAFTGPYLRFLQERLLTDIGRAAMEVAGMLRNEKFVPLMMRVYPEKKFEAVRGAIVEAMGNIGSHEVVDLLRRDVQLTAKQADGDPAKQRECMLLLSALGKIVRSPRTPADVRVGLAEFVCQHIPETNVRLATHAAVQVVGVKAEDLSHRARHWAIRVLVHALWMPDESAEFARGDDRQRNILGHRSAPAEQLKGLAAKEVDTFIAAVEKYSLRYSGAYMAVAEICEKVNDPRTVPMLERLLNAALMHSAESSNVNVYQAEFYWDTATQQRVELTKDKIVAPIVYAIGMVGGEDGKRIIRDVQMQIKAGRLALPGEETARFLTQFGGIDALKETPDANPFEEPPPPDPEEVKELIKAATASYFLQGSEKRRIKKITAISRLGQLTPTDAIQPLLELLGDKDSMVANAAVGALANYRLPGRAHSLHELVLEETLMAADSKDPAVRSGIQKVLREFGVGREEVRSAILRAIKATERAETRRCLEEVLRGAPAQAGLRELSEAAGGEVRDGTAPAEGPGAGKKSMMDLKREYMLARQAWIAGGKKGNPPTPPPGMTN